MAGRDEILIKPWHLALTRRRNNLFLSGVAGGGRRDGVSISFLQREHRDEWFSPQATANRLMLTPMKNEQSVTTMEKGEARSPRSLSLSLSRRPTWIS